MDDRELRSAVCKTLLDNIGHGFLWDGSAPSGEAHRLLEDDMAPISAEDRLVLGAALALCAGSPGPTFGDLLRAAPLHAELLGSLLVAAARGPAMLELWIRQNQATHEQRAGLADARGIGANIHP